jgi:hypothetical protein
MEIPKEFRDNFAPYAVPPVLVKLFRFQEDVSEFEGYSEGFGLVEDAKDGLESWSDDSAFLSRLLPFAQANGSGSFYALWADATSKDASTFPVVAFGDEGGVHVVAQNVLDLLRILAFDSEPMIDHAGVTFYKDEDDHEGTEDHDTYVEWLEEVGLKPVADPAEIVDAAQAKHKVAFDAWFAEYHEDEDEDGDDDD